MPLWQNSRKRTEMAATLVKPTCHPHRNSSSQWISHWQLRTTRLLSTQALCPLTRPPCKPLSLPQSLLTLRRVAALRLLWLRLLTLSKEILSMEPIQIQSLMRPLRTCPIAMCKSRATSTASLAPDSQWSVPPSQQVSSRKELSERRSKVRKINDG